MVIIAVLDAYFNPAAVIIVCAFLPAADRGTVIKFIIRELITGIRNNREREYKRLHIIIVSNPRVASSVILAVRCLGIPPCIRICIVRRIVVIDSAVATYVARVNSVVILSCNLAVIAPLAFIGNVNLHIVRSVCRYGIRVNRRTHKRYSV